MRSRLCRLTMIIACAAAWACAEPTAVDGPEQAALPAPVDSPSQELPPGHPPIAPAAGGSRIVEPPAGSGTGAAALRWEAPDDWQPVEPSSAMRKAQYRVPGAAGEAECVVFYFGPGQGGDAMANALRWADQFSRPDGGSARDALITETIEVDGMAVLLAEVAGTYSGGMAMMGGPRESLENYMLLGAVAEGPDANWFFKLTGPSATVIGQRDAFRAMVGSLSQGR